MSKKNSKLAKFLFIVISFCLLFVYLFINEDIDSLQSSFGQLNLKYILLGFLFVISYISCDALSIFTLRRQFQTKVSYLSCLKASFISIGLGLITPFTSGYIAGQITIMGKSGMSASDGATVVLQKTIRYIFFGLIANLFLIISNQDVFEITLTVKIMVIVSIAGTALYLIFLSLVSKAEKTLTIISIGIVRFGHKIHIIKRIEKLETKIKKEIHLLNYRMTNHKISFSANFITMISCLLELFLLYLVTWSIYMSFYSKNPTFTVFQVMGCQSLCNVILQVAPIPGGLGIVDATFHDVMTKILGSHLNISLIIWRLLTFYFPIMMSFILMGFKNKVYQSSKNIQKPL
ncbi:MAG: lysylphosphatidylglycerol synthase transmembrane domain-containing protein [Sphaerochaetaceae bacterium]|nr:lysylphosphatidylglycerol synthase transmembrane domain-containing protein [Sphaerochaetaceae bacterium]